MAKKAAGTNATAWVPMFPERDIRLLTWYERSILEEAAKHGGFFNAHAHLCRAHTLRGEFLAHIGTSPLEASNLPLSVKQDLVGDLHRGKAYTEANLRERMTYAIERQIAFGVTRADTNIDATPDLPEDGLLAIRIALELKREYDKRGIDIRIAPTPIFGFKSDTKDKRPRWDVFAEASRKCDYISLLPEKDENVSVGNRDACLGFKHHIRMGLELACELGKEVQFHLDQMDIPGERGTERFLETLEVLDQPKSKTGEPMIWIIHMISPSAYGEERFARLVDKLLRFNVGVIVCPSAALSMRQLRSIDAPTHNSIARVLELVKMRVPIRIGTDNIEDVFVPMGNGDMLTEIMEAASSLRIALPSLWGKLAAGARPNNVDIHHVGRILHEDRKACFKVAPDGWKPAVE